MPCLACVLYRRCVRWLYKDKACFARLLPLLPRLPWCAPPLCPVVLCGLRVAASDGRSRRLPVPGAAPPLLGRLTPVYGVCRMRLLTPTKRASLPSQGPTLLTHKIADCLKRLRLPTVIQRFFQACCAKLVAAGYSVC